MSKMIKCKTCGADIASNAKNCPSCGAKNPKPFYKRWWFILIVIFVVIGALGSGENKNTSNKDSTATTTKQVESQKEKYEIVGDVKDTRDSYSLYIEGTLKNNTNKEASYVQVSYNLFDKNGNQIGTALANTNNLAPGGTWKFKAMAMIDNPKEVASYKLGDVSGF